MRGLVVFFLRRIRSDQGEENVVLVVVVDIVVAGGDHFSVSHVQFFGV